MMVYRARRAARRGWWRARRARGPPRRCGEGANNSSRLTLPAHAADTLASILVWQLPPSRIFATVARDSPARLAREETESPLAAK